MSNSKTNETMERAKNTLSKTKTAVSNITAKNGTDKIIPGFSGYAINAAGQVVSLSTGKIQQIPAGKNKYLIFNDKKERRSISLDEIKEKTKFNSQPAKKQGSKKDSGEPRVTQKERVIELHGEGKTAKEIAELLGIKYNSVYIAIKVHTIMKLNSKGHTPKQIAEKTGYGIDSIIWQINK